MHRFNSYTLFLFDFDGLLVNSELFHFRAYKMMCKNRGFDLDWDFNRYIQIAHYSAEGLEKQVYGLFPDLRAQEPDWSVLYGEKKANLIHLFHTEAVPLMPGVEKILHRIDSVRARCCVVTHSDRDLVTIIREKNPTLNLIPHWITRSDYNAPKPSPECYISAIKKLGVPGDRVVGFEDTPRGLNALLGTDAQAVLVTEMDYPETPSFVDRGVLHYRNFDDLVLDW